MRDCLFCIPVPEGQGENIDLEVYNFTGAGGVALSMYNTDEVVSQFVRVPLFPFSAYYYQYRV